MICSLSKLNIYDKKSNLAWQIAQKETKDALMVFHTHAGESLKSIGYGLFSNKVVYISYSI